MEQRKINPWAWQDAIGFTQAIEVSGAQRVLFCAGQTSVDANGVPQHEGDIEAQATLALDNLETVLKAAGMTLANIVRATVYTTDVDGLMAVTPKTLGRLNAAGCRPASTLVGVTRLAFPQLMVEIEATAVA